MVAGNGANQEFMDTIRAGKKRTKRIYEHDMRGSMNQEEMEI